MPLCQWLWEPSQGFQLRIWLDWGSQGKKYCYSVYQVSEGLQVPVLEEEEDEGWSEYTLRVCSYEVDITRVKVWILFG